MPLLGKNGRVLINGSDLTPHFREAIPTYTRGTSEVTAFKANSQAFIAALRGGTLALQGYFDANGVSPDTAHEILGALLGTEGDLVTFGYDTVAVGRPITLLRALATEYGTTQNPAEAIAATLALQADGGLEAGVALHDVDSPTTTSGNGAAVNHGAPTTGGGVAHLHVVDDPTGTGPTLDVVIEDSADGSTDWQPIATFAQATARGAQRILINGTIRAHTRAARTIGGTGGPAFQYGVALVRR